MSTILVFFLNFSYARGPGISFFVYGEIELFNVC
jgi:hypothetical protein